MPKQLMFDDNARAKLLKGVEKLAGAILEKIAWEVVPDMSESLIREEIRKIRDAAA